LFNVDAPSPALQELERQERLNENVLRYLTVLVPEHEDGPSAMMRKADRDRERDREERGGFRDRERGGFRDRERGEQRREREREGRARADDNTAGEE
jgi:small subunit ribosomal protein S6